MDLRCKIYDFSHASISYYFLVVNLNKRLKVTIQNRGWLSTSYSNNQTIKPSNNLGHLLI